MNNWNVFNAIKDFFDTSSGAEIAILIFIILNILITAFNSWVQFKLKYKDRENISFKIKEEKKIEIYENIFKQMQQLNYSDVTKEQNVYLEDITKLEKYKEINKLYICSKTSNIVTEFCDYCKMVLTDFRKKDLKKEEKFVNNFKKIYTK